MPSRDDFQFVLLPWEHRGAHFDPRPDAITHIHFASAQRTVLLKAKAHRLFFCFTDWPGERWCEATFAITTPFLSNIRHAEQFFHEAMVHKKAARYFLFDYRHEIPGVTTLLLLINENGTQQTGWAREWCGGDWIAWEDELPSCSDYSIWDEQWHPSLSRAIYDIIWPTLARRRFTATERQDLPVHWQKGSPNELSHLLRAYFGAFPQASHKINERLEEWGEYGWTGDLRVRLWAWNAASGGVAMKSTLWNNTSTGSRCDLLAYMTPQWAELIAQQNYAVGLIWHYNGQGGTERRENWWCETPVFDLNVPLPFLYPPSQHEQMEARLFLRDWLLTKLPDANLEEWLPAATS